MKVMVVNCQKLLVLNCQKTMEINCQNLMVSTCRLQMVEIGDSTTFFCYIRNIQMDKKLVCEDIFDIDLTLLDPVVYSGRYHSIGKMLGKIGDFV